MKIILYLLIIVFNIFNKVYTQFYNNNNFNDSYDKAENMENNVQISNNFNTYDNNNNNQNINANNREGGNYDTNNYHTTNQNPILQAEYDTNNVYNQNISISNPTIQPNQYQSTQYNVNEVQNSNAVSQPSTLSDTTQYFPDNISVQQSSYNLAAIQYSTNEPSSQKVSQYSDNNPVPRGDNRNINSLTRGNSFNESAKNDSRLLADYSEAELENNSDINISEETVAQLQYKYSQGWLRNEEINRNEIVEPHLEYEKYTKYSTPNAPDAQYYQKFYNIYNYVENQEKNDLSKYEMESINDDFNGRSIVVPGQYPHMAAIGFLSNEEKIEFKCGGSLISDYFVITAAHCCSLNGEHPILVKLGIINLKNQTGNIEPQRIAIKEIIVHPSYNSSLNYHDIALIKLQSAAEFTEFVRPILLWASDYIPYERIFTMGYGSTSFAKAPTNILTELTLNLIPLQKCRQILHDEKLPFGILESQLCGHDLEKNRDTCQGDSGGPLQLNLEHRTNQNTYRYYLVGIISYGEFCGSNKPGIYTKVSSYCQWIASIVWPEYFKNF